MNETLLIYCALSFHARWFLERILFGDKDIAINSPIGVSLMVFFGAVFWPIGIPLILWIMSLIKPPSINDLQG